MFLYSKVTVQQRYCYVPTVVHGKISRVKTSLRDAMQYWHLLFSACRCGRTDVPVPSGAVASREAGVVGALLGAEQDVGGPSQQSL